MNLWQYHNSFVRAVSVAVRRCDGWTGRSGVRATSPSIRRARKMHRHYVWQMGQFQAMERIEAIS